MLGNTKNRNITVVDTGDFNSASDTEQINKAFKDGLKSGVRMFCLNKRFNIKEFET